MKKLLCAGMLALILTGCSGINKKPYQDINAATAGYAAELSAYWDADVKAGKHEQAWSDAKKAQMKAYIDAMNAAVK